MEIVMMNALVSSSINLKSSLLILLILLLLSGCQEGVDTQDGVEASVASQKAEAEGGKGEATVIMEGEKLPVRRLDCNFRERGQNIMVYFDLEPRGYVDLFVASDPGHDSKSPKVTLRLPTALGDERGFDLWKSEAEENLPLTETGVSGTFEIEGVDRGYGSRETALLEVDVTCPK